MTEARQYTTIVSLCLRPDKTPQSTKQLERVPAINKQMVGLIKSVLVFYFFRGFRSSFPSMRRNYCEKQAFARRH